jgi:hypothetical protein
MVLRWLLWVAQFHGLLCGMATFVWSVAAWGVSESGMSLLNPYITRWHTSSKNKTPTMQLHSAKIAAMAQGRK